jgi:hypothetical protein
MATKAPRLPLSIRKTKKSSAGPSAYADRPAFDFQLVLSDFPGEGDRMKITTKALTLLCLIVASHTSFAYQPSDGCHWLNASSWSCSPTNGGSDYAQIEFSTDWNTAQITMGACNPGCAPSFSGNFNFTKSDGTNDTYSSSQGDVLSLPTGSCNATSGFDVTLRGESFRCE